mgnify:CR=1 FL=1
MKRYQKSQSDTKDDKLIKEFITKIYGHLQQKHFMPCSELEALPAFEQPMGKQVISKMAIKAKDRYYLK